MKKRTIQHKKESTTCYKGTVEVGIIKNGKKYKKVTTNAGTLALFQYLCNCLAARLNPNISVDISQRPGSVALFNGSTAVLSYNIPVNDVSIESIQSTSNPRCSVIFNFLIPGTTILNKDIKDLKLRSVNGNTTFAEASFGSAISVNDIDTNIYITWTLTIMNK